MQILNNTGYSLLIGDVNPFWFVRAERHGALHMVSQKHIVKISGRSVCEVAKRNIKKHNLSTLKATAFERHHLPGHRCDWAPAGLTVKRAWETRCMEFVDQNWIAIQQCLDVCIFWMLQAKFYYYAFCMCFWALSLVKLSATQTSCATACVMVSSAEEGPPAPVYPSNTHPSPPSSEWRDIWACKWHWTGWRLIVRLKKVSRSIVYNPRLSFSNTAKDVTILNADSYCNTVLMDRSCNTK